MKTIDDVTHVFRSMTMNYGLGKLKPLGYVKSDISGREGLISTLGKIGVVELCTE
jgi:hypothetical protein